MTVKPNRKEVVVVGGGPGGYVAAIRLGQLGKSVALIEKGTLGGVCLNWGCIPSKALIHVAKLYEQMQNSSELGIQVKDLKIDLKKTQNWKKEVVKKLTGGISQLVKNLGVEIVKGQAVFETSHRIQVKGANSGNEAIEFEHAIVASGSRPIEIPGFSMDGKNVVDSREALDWTSPPERMVVIGGGVIGLEIGMLYAKFGTEVTVVELTHQLLPGIDVEVAQTIEKICKQKKISIFTSSKALGYKKTRGGLGVEIQTPKGNQEILSDVILLSVGRAPDSNGLNLSEVGVHVTQGMIPVNKQLQTNLPHIYAIGDVSGPPLLAHKASKEGLVAAQAIAGHSVEYDVLAMPATIFTDPEIAVVGMTENEAKAKGIDSYSGKFPFVALGRAVSTNHPEGFVKIVGERGTNLLLGVQIIGATASDLISEASLAIEMGATVEDLALTVHPHPTMSESIMEAAHAALGEAIHISNRISQRTGLSRDLR